MAKKHSVFTSMSVKMIVAAASFAVALGTVQAIQPTCSFAKEAPGSRASQRFEELATISSTTTDTLKQALDEAIAKAEQDVADAEAVLDGVIEAQYDAEVAVRNAQDAYDNALREQQAAEEELSEAQKAAEEAGATEEKIAQAKEAADAAAAKVAEANEKVETAAAATKQAEDALKEAEEYKQDTDDTLAYYYESMDEALAEFHRYEEQYNDAVSRGDEEAAAWAYNMMMDSYDWYFGFAYYVEDREAEAAQAAVDVETKQGELEEAKAAQAIAEEEAEQVARDAQPAIDAYNALADAAKRVEDAQAELDTVTQAVEDAEVALTEAEAALDEANAALDKANDDARAAAERLAALRNLAGFLFDVGASWGANSQFGWQHGISLPILPCRPALNPYRNCFFVRAFRSALFR